MDLSAKCCVVVVFLHVQVVCALSLKEYSLSSVQLVPEAFICLQVSATGTTPSRWVESVKKKISASLAQRELGVVDADLAISCAQFSNGHLQVAISGQEKDVTLSMIFVQRGMDGAPDYRWKGQSLMPVNGDLEKTLDLEIRRLMEERWRGFKAKAA